MASMNHDDLRKTAVKGGVVETRYDERLPWHGRWITVHKSHEGVQLGDALYASNSPGSESDHVKMVYKVNQQEPSFKVWISKYLFSMGLKEMTVVESPKPGVVLGHGEGVLGRCPGQLMGTFRAGEWHKTREEAVAKAEVMRFRQIASFKRKVAKLEKLKFRRPKPRRGSEEEETVWWTDFALTKGIKEVVVVRGQTPKEPEGRYLESSHFHLTYEKALAKAEIMRVTTIRSLKKQILKLEHLKFQ